MNFTAWLLLGFFAVTPLLLYANKLNFQTTIKLLGRGLVVAAIIYLGFALAWGNAHWLAVEFIGVFIYSLFYWLSIKHNALWLSLGWLLHPAWDIFLHLTGPGEHVAPAWYAVACVSFDFAVAVYTVYRIRKQARKSHASVI